MQKVDYFKSISITLEFCSPEAHFVENERPVGFDVLGGTLGSGVGDKCYSEQTFSGRTREITLSNALGDSHVDFHKETQKSLETGRFCIYS